jgi:hypothetical protein
MTKMLIRSMEMSSLAAWAKVQKPSCNWGIFVVMMATSMIIVSGMAARREASPIRMNNPPRVSKKPTKYAVNSGYLI